MYFICHNTFHITYFIFLKVILHLNYFATKMIIIFIPLAAIYIIFRFLVELEKPRKYKPDKGRVSF